MRSPELRRLVKPERPAEHALGRRAQKRLATWHELLRAGRHLFGRVGLYESRVEDLTQQAGIAKGTIYGYFRNKEELVVGVVRSTLEELEAAVLSGVAGARTSEEVWVAAAEAHLRFFQRNPDVMRILHQVRGLLKFPRPESARLRRLLDGYLDRLAILLVPGAAAGEARAREMALVLFGAVSGIASTRAALSSPPVVGLGPRATARAVARLVREYARAAGRARPGNGRRVS